MSVASPFSLPLRVNGDGWRRKAPWHKGEVFIARCWVKENAIKRCTETLAWIEPLEKCGNVLVLVLIKKNM